MKQKILILLTIATCFFALSDSRSTVDAADNKVFFNIRDYGAKGDGTTLDTAVIDFSATKEI